MEQIQYDLPDGWHWKLLDEISEKITDGTHHSPKLQYSEWEEGRFKYITSKNIKNYGMKLDDISYIGEDVHSEIYARCAPAFEDQLLTKDGAMTGTCCLNELNEPFSLLSSVALIKQKRSIVSPRYLNYYLQSNVGQNFLLGDISGAAITRTNIRKLKSTPVPLAPKEKQDVIVEKLDALLTRINSATEHLQESIALKNSLLQSALDRHFSAIPDRKTIETLADVKGGKRLPKGEQLISEVTDYPYIRVTDFTDKGTIDLSNIQYISREIHEQIKRYVISRDDLYISIAGTIGKTGFVPSELDGANLTENAAKLVIKDKEQLDLSYLYFFTLTSDFSAQAGLATKTVAQPKLALTRLSKIEVPICSLEEQKLLVVTIETFKSKIQEIEEVLWAKINDLQTLKASILDSAFKGEL